MSAAAPLWCEWSGEAFVPLPRFAKQCDADFVIGERYPLEIHQERSGKSHRHYFAAVRDAWRNLRPPFDAHHPTDEHLRKFALIMTGYEDRTTHVCGSEAEARRLRAFIAPLDDFAVVEVVKGTSVVAVRRAKSQSAKAMGRAEFQRSKDDVLAYIADMIDVTPGALRKHAEAA